MLKKEVQKQLKQEEVQLEIVCKFLGKDVGTLEKCFALVSIPLDKTVKTFIKKSDSIAKHIKILESLSDTGLQQAFKNKPKIFKNKFLVDQDNKDCLEIQQRIETINPQNKKEEEFKSFALREITSKTEVDNNLKKHWNKTTPEEWKKIKLQELNAEKDKVAAEMKDIYGAKVFISRVEKHMKMFG